MPRIRTVKPEFWSDEKLAPLPDGERLLFLGMISMADDLGRIHDSPKQIEAFVWPHQDRAETVREGLARLSQLSRIIRGKTASGQAIIQIANWARHQKVDKPSLKSALPEIVTPDPLNGPRGGLSTSSRESRETDATSSRSDLDLRPTTDDLRPTTDEADPRVSTPAAATAARSGRTRTAGETALITAAPVDRRAALTSLFDNWVSGVGYADGKTYCDPEDLSTGCLEYLAGESSPSFRPRQIMKWVMDSQRRRLEKPNAPRSGKPASWLEVA